VEEKGELTAKVEQKADQGNNSQSGKDGSNGEEE
jgi:hypothetical protein